jgi:hypothetical protein
MAQLTPGRFVGYENYATDNLEAYSTGAISLLDQPTSVGTVSFNPGNFSSRGGNYATDDIEMEITGPIEFLTHGQRNGDTMLDQGRFNVPSPH